MGGESSIFEKVDFFFVFYVISVGFEVTTKGLCHIVIVVISIGEIIFSYFCFVVVAFVCCMLMCWVCYIGD